MNVFIGIVGFAVMILGLVLTLESKKKQATVCWILGIVIAISSGCFKIVPTGYTGVRTTFGQISAQAVQRGFNFKIPFVQSISLVNNKQQDVTIKGDIWGETKEKTPVFASDVVITYQINGDRSSWIYANVNNLSKDLIDQNLVASAVKSAMVELSFNEVTNRNKIESLVKERLDTSLLEKYGESTVTILKVVINNMDFEEGYNEAIAAKSIAQQNYEKQQIENNTAIAKAEADKKVEIAKAEAKSEATLITAQAEADANKLLAGSLTDEVLRSKFYARWDGKLPTVMGDNTVITDIGSAE